MNVLSLCIGVHVSETETRTLSGWVCGACGCRYAERIELCVRCFRSGVCIPDYRRVTDELLPPTRRTTARRLAAEDQRVFSLGPYPDIKIQRNAFVVTHGGPNSGKTTQLLRILEGLCPAVMVSAEMKAGPALAGYLRRLEIRRDDLEIIEPQSTSEIMAAARSGVRAVGIDSLTLLTLLPDDCVALARGGDIVVIGILQENKSGQAAGSNSWLHAADVIVRCDNMTWTLEKSRYQALGVTGGVLCA